ncbi:MAG: deoxynucleoside kinase [Trichococcus flocculiformis]|jgi:deoxyadenosine/deoxycytidine kinase|uniref:Deoxynucleoside kinase n=3 Tax=root TaxID=1 RepID=A0A847D4D7_9LACT|nr:deoxynucleoside kinase [Trichococcus sp.]NLD31713.1 deoxynucleoside kinase [Trichococcus flocculiformis]MBP6247292.1 deoxynucleoside kinase [Trichococcus sp.]MBP7128217.1 deoxynucleoside kinase [Trichococcus sp.]MBP8682923.1 deoxynucleoside kinase [Trichococcus sp.]
MAGMIGAGKSTYTEMISRRLGTEAFFESVDYNPILDKFYDNPQKWAFSLQIYFLNTRFRSIKAALTDDNNVLDRSIYEDALFTRVNHLQGNISQEEMDIYNDLLANMMEELEGMPKKAPDLLIYLDGSFETILDHIRKRGREFEQIEDDSELLSYYELLFKNYEQWYQEYDQSPKIKINIDTFDIVNNSGDEEKVMSIIENALLEVRGEEVELTCAGSNIV